MGQTYEFTPGTWHPMLAGTVAGATGAIVAALLSLPLRSPDEIVANSLSVTIVSLVVGAISGLLWRRLRAMANGRRLFAWTMAGGFVVAMMAIALVDRTMLDNTLLYAAPLAAIIFLTVGALTPLYAGVVGRQWAAGAVIVLALALGVGLFGRGNVASGELTLDDVTTTTASPTTSAALAGDPTSTTTMTTPTTTLLSGSVEIDELASEYVVESGIVTYAVEEQLQGLASVGVGMTRSVSGGFDTSGTFEFSIDLQSFESDQGRRDDRVRGWFADFPTGTFSGTGFTIPSSIEVGDVLAFDVDGTMTINGISLAATWAVEARLEPTGSISVTGESFIVLSEFNVPVLSGGFVTMEDGATIEVAFSAVPSS